MKTRLKPIAVFSLLLTGQKTLAAEEVLARRRLIIAPPRLENARDAQRAGGRLEKARLPKPNALRLVFRPGSMRLTEATERALRGLRGTQKILRVTGFGDTARSDEKLANLRARAVASYLAEYSDLRGVELDWQANACAEAEVGATVEEKE